MGPSGLRPGAPKQQDQPSVKTCPIGSWCTEQMMRGYGMNLGKLMAIFVAIPLIELALLIKVGQWIGPIPTILLVIVTGILGASLARWQGFLVYNRIQQELNAGRMPTRDMVDGLLILVGGIVLLTPGLLTDLCGFALLLPPVRSQIRKGLQKKFIERAQPGMRQTHDPTIIDV